MTGRVIPLRGDPHAEVQALLPWFVTGALEPDDLARVEDHLDQCSRCRAEVAGERRLRDEINALQVQVEPGPAPMRARAADRPRRLIVGWAMAASAAMVVGGLALSWRPVAPTAAYRALGAAPAAAAPGNLVVIFRPQAREADMREAFRASHARLVDGPTAADAYVLRVAPGERAQALAVLRVRAGVVLAEPIDPGGSP